MYKYIWVNKLDDNAIYFKGTKIAVAEKFERIVHGGRGAYVEFDEKDIISSGLYVPESQAWRLHSDKAYYIELRHMEYKKAKIYSQLKTVDYADYKVGYYYISPVYLENFVRCEKYVNNNLS